MRNPEPDDALREAVAQKTETAAGLLRRVAADYPPAVLANSLSAEDMVLTDLIVRERLDIGNFSLDTGRLPPETHDLMAKIRARYGLALIVHYPRHEAVEDYVRAHGIDAFYESVELRKACCHARKVEPLRRALAGKRAWITGMRAQQSATRAGLATQAFDDVHGLEKFNPLADWTEREVWAYVRLNGVPYNALHDRHYASIGCAPCTRAITVGEDVRAGRWWWEQPETKECGLHAREA
ncbi:MAG: phosphoadenylyl-sulfate reductase [Candidatus Accumulibacter sp.]|nr:phosphoadenylyl-sulfate reductase [Accumulibacter sp.]